MLDECKGDKLEEVLAVFSNVVLQKRVREEEASQYEPIALRLALEKFSYNEERTGLSALILAHRASLNRHLREKEEAKARYKDFSELLSLSQRRVTRRSEQLKEAASSRGPRAHISPEEVETLQDRVQTNWSGNDEWLASLLHGDGTGAKGGLLSTPFEKVWDSVEGVGVGELEAKENSGLLQQLESRVRNQEERLARWQAFGEKLSKGNTKSRSQEQEFASLKKNKIDLGFTVHEGLQVNKANTDEALKPTRTTRLPDYVRLVEKMQAELANVGKIKPQERRERPKSIVSETSEPDPTPSPVPSAAHSPEPSKQATETAEEDWSSVSSETELSPLNSNATKSIPQTPASDPPTVHQEHVKRPNISSAPYERSRKGTQPRQVKEPENSHFDEPYETVTKTSVPLKPAAGPSNPTRRLEPPPPLPTESEILADDILNSMTAASPSPKKVRQTLSLAERTRVSMARVSFAPADLEHELEESHGTANLALRPAATKPATTTTPEADDKYAGLIERTRKSMVNFEDVQKKVQIERRKSYRDAKKKQRESSFFPKVEEEPVVTPSIETAELFEGDADYESVFMSRPKIKTSPATSPVKNWDREDEYGQESS